MSRMVHNQLVPLCSSPHQCSDFNNDIAPQLWPLIVTTRIEHPQKNSHLITLPVCMIDMNEKRNHTATKHKGLIHFHVYQKTLQKPRSDQERVTLSFLPNIQNANCSYVDLLWPRG